MSEFRSGFVAIMGRPNVGKSSIMNYFIGEKVAIVSNHPQTTRSRLLGVATREDWQIVFVDTPGLHKPRTKLGQYMMKTAEEAKEGVDAVLAVVDGQFIGDGDRAILAELAKMNCPKFLAVNKIDIANPEKLMPQLAKLNGKLRRQKEFLLTGQSYAKFKPGAPPDLAGWYNLKDFSLSHDSGDVTETFDGPALVERLVKGSEFLMPFYDYFYPLSEAGQAGLTGLEFPTI